MFVLTNALGLYLMSMGSLRNGYSFTQDVNLAMKFSTAEEAEYRQKALRMLKVKITKL